MELDQLSEHERSIEPRKPASFADLVRYLNSRNAQLACGTCGKYDWTLLLAEDGVAAAQIRHPVLAEHISYPSYCAVCTNCGHMNFYMSGVVNEWVEQNPEDETHGAE